VSDRRRLLLVNPNTTAAYTERMVRAAAAAAPDGVDVVGATVPAGVLLIRDEADLAVAAASVAALPDTRAVTEDAVIVAAFADPGVEALRARLSVPVVGIAEAAIRATAPRPFAVATTLPSLNAAIRRRVEACGASARFTGIRTPPGDGAALMGEPERLVDALAALVEAGVADGAEAVIIGGGPLSDAAAAVRARTRVPVVEPVPAAVRALTPDGGFPADGS